MASIKIANQPFVPEPTPVKATDPTYKHSIVSSKQVPLNALITHIAGSSYVVDYYSQVLGLNQQPQDYNPTQGGVNQQYNLIKDFELKLQSYDVSSDDQTGELSVTGSAVVYPPLKPNKGDPFIADIGNGMVGQFTIIRVSQKYYFKTTTYEVDFILARIFNTKALVDELDAKIVETYNFIKDFLTYGQNPLLVNDEYIALETARKCLTQATDDYVKEFLSRELGTLVVPDYPNSTYDPFALRAFLSVVNNETHPMIRQIKELNVDELKEYYAFSIWNCLINPSTHNIYSVWRRARPANINQFNLYPRMGSLRYSGFKWCVKPIDVLDNVDHYSGEAARSQVGILDPLMGTTGYRGPDYTSALPACDLCNNHHHHHLEPARASCSHDGTPCPCPCHVLTPAIDDHYVLSEMFFDDTPGVKDEFEYVVKAHLDLEPIDTRRIVTLLNARKLWNRHERFYKQLTLIIILIAAIRRM